MAVILPTFRPAIQISIKLTIRTWDFHKAYHLHSSLFTTFHPNRTLPMNFSQSTSIQGDHTDSSAHGNTEQPVGDTYHGSIVNQGSVMIVGGHAHTIVMPQEVHADTATLLQSLPSRDLQRAMFDESRALSLQVQGLHAHMLDESQRDCLKQLPHAPARYSDYRTKASECLSNTRVELRRRIDQWVDEEMKKDTPSQFIFWLCGLPGAGKSSIAKTVAKALDRRRLLGASFFFSRDDDTCNNYQLVIPTIARQLGFFNANVGLHITEFLKIQPDAATDSMSYQLENLIMEPLRKTHSDGALIPFVIAMDGLDECVNSAQVQNMLELLANEFRKLPVPVLIFITSRPESYLESRFCSQDISPLVSTIRLHDMDEGTVTSDIKLYLEAKLKDIALTHTAHEDGSWLHINDIELLSKQASCLFIYAVTAVTFIGDEDGIPEDRMRLLLDRQPLDEECDDNPYILMDSLYLRILRDALGGGKRTTSDVRDIVGTIVTLRYPLPYKALMRFMAIRLATLNSVLQKLSSVIIYSHSQEVRVRHQSFPDFLTRCTNQDFRIDSHVHHTRLAKLCLRLLLSDSLKKNMCPNFDISTLNSEVSNAAESLLPELTYACLHFAWHLVNGRCEDEEIRVQMDTFLKVKLLHWFEALSLLGRLDAAFASLAQVDRWYKASALSDPTTSRLVYDAKRFVQMFFDPISQSAQQVYVSALCFAPHSTLMQTYGRELTTSNVKLIAGKDEQWSPCVSVITGHSSPVNCVAFSSDNTRIVSGSMDDTARVWDAASGALQATLVHHDMVHCVAFSSDNTRIISGSFDHTVRVWDVSSGALQTLLLGHTGPVWSVSFSSDNTRIVSGSRDNTIRVWDATCGTLKATLRGHAEGVFSVSFSSNNTRIVSGSEDSTVRMWDAASGALQATLQGHADCVNSIAVSTDNARIVSGSDDNTVRVWDATSGALQATLQGHSRSVISVAFSSNNTRIVSGSADGTVRVWDATFGILQATLQGHADLVNSVAFSFDNTRIVSGSNDNTVRVWDATSSTLRTKLPGYGVSVYCDSFSSDNNDATFGGFGTALLGDAGSDYSVSLSSDDSEATPSDLQATLEGCSGWVFSVAFSTDNTRIVSGSTDNTIRVLDATSGALQATLQGHADLVLSVAFSFDDTRIVSGSWDNTVRVWDTISGTLQGTLEGHADSVNSVAFSTNNARIVSGSDDNTVRVWDATSGSLQMTLRGHVSWVASVAFSSDHTRIVSGSADHTVRVWDATSGALQTILQGHADCVMSIAFSLDNTQILSWSGDQTIHVWDITSASPICILPGRQALISASFALDVHGWIRDISTHKRLCWVPASLRRHLKGLSCREPGRVVFGSAHNNGFRDMVPVMFSVINLI